MDYIEEFVKATYAVRDSVEKLDTPFMERISESLDTIAKQLTIANQLTMFQLCRTAQMECETKGDQQALFSVLSAIDKGVSYIGMREGNSTD